MLFMLTRVSAYFHATTSTGSVSESDSFVNLEVAAWLHVETLVNQRVTFTDTSSRKSSMEVAVWLQVETLVNQQVTFTDTSSKRSGMPSLRNETLVNKLSNHYSMPLCVSVCGG